jgi:hypothetical protein
VFEDIYSDVEAEAMETLLMVDALQVESVSGFFDVLRGEYLPVVRVPGLDLSDVPFVPGQDIDYFWNMIVSVGGGKVFLTIEWSGPVTRKIWVDLTEPAAEWLPMITESGMAFGMTGVPKGEIWGAREMIDVTVSRDDLFERILAAATFFKEERRAKIRAKREARGG